MRRWLDGLQPWALFLLRVALGMAMLYHGWNKVGPEHWFHGGNHFAAIDHWSHTIVSMGMPYWLGYISALTEFFGGIFLILGFLTRFASVMVCGEMIVAIVAVHIRHGYGPSEYPLALLVIAIAVATSGAGAAALDNRIGFE